MQIFTIIIFIVGYLAIAFEHPLKIDKAASALITGVLCWLMYFLSAHSTDEATEHLLAHFGDISSILFFLLGAMTIVELIDTYGGFEIIKEKIKTRSVKKLLFIVVTITFFLSALLDNLTTAIVMTSLSSKLLSDRKDRLLFAGMIIIAANTGGAWSPLGDVTTTMLWIGSQVTALNIILKTFIPSLIGCLVPLLVASRQFKGKMTEVIPPTEKARPNGGNTILLTGVGLLIFVPLFKTVTHLPPFMGMLLALAIIWIVSTVINTRKNTQQVGQYSVTNALQRIDAPSILFFLGILLAVSALQAFGILQLLANLLQNTLKNDYLIATALGLLSALVDNVPLVAAAQGMYDLGTYPTDHNFWEFLALTTGSGGSAIIIGSAAGVAVMGIENISFTWYLKNISWLAIIGFVAGILTYLLQQSLFF